VRQGDRAGAVTLVVAGGGTGGHLYPGIAVARELLRRQPAARVSFAGTAHGIEARVVPREGFELDVIRSAGLKGKSLAARLRGAALVPAGLAGAWRLLSARRPHVVLGVGGYSSGPVVLAAAVRGIPTMVLEQNVVPGLTNRLLARVVRAAAVAFDDTLPFFRRRGFVAGNPVRAEFFETGGASGIPADAGRRVLVLGGSQGARAINRTLREAAPLMTRRVPDFELVHQTGARDLAGVREDYQRAGFSARVEAFIDEVAAEMRAADLVICRAGATTLAELAAAGRPALLIPFPGATDDHQRRNAGALAAAGAAVVIDERDLTPTRLADAAVAILADATQRRAMGEAMRRFARPDAAARIVDRVIELAGRAKGATA
jgi:UDP-N-acetylglucosamine--N-acetylmuramyl-(pentapeptide) pyrophosphoryl-undecaprenol N-acetylglucosamine transferase